MNLEVHFLKSDLDEGKCSDVIIEPNNDLSDKYLLTRDSCSEFGRKGSTAVLQ